MSTGKKLWCALIVALTIIVLMCAAGGCQSGGGNGKILGIFGSGQSDNSPEDGKESLFSAVEGMNWLVTLSILGMAAGVFAFINGSKIGIPVVVSCAVALFMSLAVARFAMWMAVFGMVGACAAVAISIIVKNKALKEVVAGVQTIKASAGGTNSKSNMREEISAALSKQANSTKKLVSKIRAKI